MSPLSPRALAFGLTLCLASAPLTGQARQIPPSALRLRLRSGCSSAHDLIIAHALVAFVTIVVVADVRTG
jgi:hypothetical protein